MIIDKPLVVIDTSCVMHLVFQFQDSDGKPIFPYTNKQRDERIQKTVEIYNTLYFLGDNINPSDYEILWVGDSVEVPYWRRKYWWDWWNSLDEKTQNKLIKPGTIKRKGYKGNRTSTPDALWCKKRFNKLSNCLMYDGYEADDIAATVNLLYPDRRIIFMTIDSDWLQLVNNYKTWVCLKGTYFPQYRDVQAGMGWFYEKLYKGTKKEQKLAEDETLNLRKIPYWKHIAGDNSDNLCAKSPIELIDLYNPPEEFQLWTQENILVDIKSKIISPQPIISIDEMLNDALELGMTGLTPALKEFYG
jgi:hypothetical protein